MERILKEIKQHLREGNWMDENMRRAAISRLENMSYIIGGPEEMYYAEQFDKDFGVGNVIKVPPDRQPTDLILI